MAVLPARASTARIGEDAFVVSASGEVDIGSVETLERELDALERQEALRVIVDLTGVTFIDSAGLGVLVAEAKRLNAVGGTFVLVADDPRILRVFEITGLDRMFDIERSLAEGVDRLVGRVERA
jgi:anti-sigma B factor antagonist